MNATCASVPKVVLRNFNGIPVNIFLNSIGFILLVIIFGVVKKKALNRRPDLSQDPDNVSWIEFFYGDHETAVTSSYPSTSSHNDYFSWIKTALKITDVKLLNRAGPDGLLYIYFQRLLIINVTMILVASLLIALPLNYSNDWQENKSTFHQTTISNVDPKSPLLWIYTIIILSYFLITILSMKMYMKQVHAKNVRGKISERTLLITGIENNRCNIEYLKQYFDQEFPLLIVENITLAYDIKKLSDFISQLDCAKLSLLYCEKYNNREGKKLKLYPFLFGRLTGNCISNKIDALDYYTERETQMNVLIEEEKISTLGKPIGIAFVTLVRADSVITLKNELRSATSNNWTVKRAPIPNDIFWQHLSVPRKEWYYKTVVINIGLVLLLCFPTAPIFVLNALQSLHVSSDFSIVYSFIGTLLLVAVAKITPALVTKSELIVEHWTKSGRSLIIMNKTLIFLLIMILILPSIGLSSTENIHKMKDVLLECVSIADQGGFFIDYIVTAALFGSAMELVRIPELALYAFRMYLSKSQAEKVYVRKTFSREFQLGANYAWLILVFTITSVYSIVCPLVTPFGLLYFVLKYLVDRYNLCFTYEPIVGGERLASSATRALGLAPILTQSNFFILNFVRSGISFLVVVQFIALVGSIFCLVTGYKLPASQSKEQVSEGESSADHFTPPILKNTDRTISSENSSDVSTSSSDLGTTSSNPENDV